MTRALVLLLLAGCATTKSTSTSEASDASGCGAPAGVATRPHSDFTGRICVKLQFPSPPAVAESGTVVLVWFRPDEKAKLMRGVYVPPSMLEQFLDRARVVPNVPLDGEKELALDYPGGDAVVVAVVDKTKQFWPTMFGGGSGNFLGVSDVATNGYASVKLDLIPDFGPPKEGCVGNRLELVRLTDPDLAGTIGNATERRLCVLLPPSYATDATRRYPVVFLFPGFSSTDTAYLRGNQDLKPKADGSGVEAILVGVDTSTKHGSTYFTDSAAGGKWDAFVPKMVAEIDKRYRTKAEAKARAVVGHSTGGFNAVSLGFRHPELFSVIGASSPDGLEFESWLTENGTVRPTWLAWSRLEHGVGGMGQIVSYAAAWSPEGTQFPFDLDSGAVGDAPWKAWLGHSPGKMLDDPAVAARVKKDFSNRLFLIVGTHDEFGLHAPTAAFDAHLTALGIPHQFVAVDTGHDTANVQQALVFALGALK